ncbi:MAG TPA: acetyl-CoA carboxylase, biotin carboxyl carrier protein, partial [Polyangia bacterium]
MRAKGKKPALPPSTTRGAHTITERVDALAEVLRRHDLSELEVEEGGVRIYVRRGGEPHMHAMTAHAHAPAPVTHAPAASSAPSAAPPPST